MPLQRIRAGAIPHVAADQNAAQLEAQLNAEGIRLQQGRTLLNRSVDSASALIVVEGAMRIGVIDDDALLAKGEGVLLPAGAQYSVRAEEESVAFVFSTRAG